jgi:hypothetical protein
MERKSEILQSQAGGAGKFGVDRVQSWFGVQKLGCNFGMPRRPPRVDGGILSNQRRDSVEPTSEKERCIRVR